MASVREMTSAQAIAIRSPCAGDSEPSLAFLHPVMQEALIAEAAAAGAEVLRPARLTSLILGDPPVVEIAVDDSVRTLRARLVVGADGRDSQLSRLAGFQRQRDPEELLSTGLLVEGEMDTEGAIHYLFGRTAGHSAAVCEVASHLYRLYLFRHTDAAPSRLSGPPCRIPVAPHRISRSVYGIGESLMAASATPRLGPRFWD